MESCVTDPYMSLMVNILMTFLVVMFGLLTVLLAASIFDQIRKNW